MICYRIVSTADDDWTVERRWLGFLWLPVIRLIGYDTYAVVAFATHPEARAYVDSVTSALG